MSLDIGQRQQSPDYTHLDKFFTNIDFVVPGYDKSCQYMVAIHETFYRWAQPWVAGRTVLDAGCGEGYGVSLLSATAKHAVGIDIKPELIEHATRHYSSGNTAFHIMDCESMAFAPESFDVVICDELLEHLPNYQAFMAGAYAILKPGGTFVCATTNAQLSFKGADGSPMNRNHFQEFTPAQFEEELARYYTDIEMYGERMTDTSEAYILDNKARGIEWLLVRLNVKHKIPIRWRNYVREKITGVKVDTFLVDGFEIVADAVDNSLYLIGCATKQ